MTISNADIIDTRFRAALARMAEAGRLATYDAPADPHLEIAAIMKRLDGGPALLFTAPKGYDDARARQLPVVPGELRGGVRRDFRGIRTFIARALAQPMPPQIVKNAPAQEIVQREGLRHRDAVAGAAPHAARTPADSSPRAS